MTDKFPAPVIRAGHWEVDLRAWGFGWHYKLGPAAELAELQAIHRAYAKLEELRGERAERPAAPPQLELGGVAAVETFAQALDQWQPRKEYDTVAGAKYGKNVAKAVRGDLGVYTLAQLIGAEGEDRLLAWKRDLLLAGLAARTIRNRFAVAGQVLRFAVGRRWMAGVPNFPKMPKKPPPRFEWTDEPSFRALRAGLYGGEHAGHLRAADTRGEAPAIYIARRRVYLSWLMYTGVHWADADVLDDGFIALDVGTYVRQNTKSAAAVPREEFEMPEPLIADFRELLRLLGREAFFCGELVAGGPWGGVNKAMRAAQGRLAIPGINITTRILRRSYAREMFKRGYTLQEVADRMGHVDLTMLREIYLRTPRPHGAVRSRWTRLPLPGSPTTHAGRRVIPFGIVTPAKREEDPDDT